MTDKSLELARVEDKLTRISEFGENIIGSNISFIDFAFSPDSLHLCFSTSRPKVFCINTEDKDLDKR